MGIEAATLASIATGAQVAGTVASAIGARNKAKAEKGAMEYQAAVARNNAQIAEWQAEDAIRRGQVTKQQSQLKTNALKGRQRAMMAERGIDLGEGSALNILTDTDMIGAIDANNATDNAAREAFGFKVQGSNYKSNADLLTARAGSISPNGAAFGSLLTGAGSVASSWYSMSSKGIFDKPKPKSAPWKGAGDFDFPTM